LPGERVLGRIRLRVALERANVKPFLPRVSLRAGALPSAVSNAQGTGHGGPYRPKIGTKQLNVHLFSGLRRGLGSAAQFLAQEVRGTTIPHVSRSVLVKAKEREQMAYRSGQEKMYR